MAWHAQKETSNCATIPTDTGRRGHSASTTNLLDTLDLGTGTRLWSSINFKTANAPLPTCTAISVTAFNPAQFAKAVLYQLLYLNPQLLSLTSHSMNNRTVN